MATAAGGMMKKAGATRGPRAPLPLLKDGKTPVSESALDRALSRFGVAVDTGDTVEVKLGKVRKELDKRIAEKAHTCVDQCEDPEKSQCPFVVCECKEVATLDTDFCPFCGSTGLPPDAAPVTGAPEAPAAVQPEPEVAPEAPPASEEPVPEEQPVEESGAGEEDAPPALASDDAPEPETGLDEEPPAPEEPEAPVSDEAALAPVEEAGLSQVQQLDASVSRIAQLKEKLAENSYDLGLELARVHNEELWKARGYGSFHNWVEQETGFSKSTAYDLMNITQTFDRETFLTVGSSKLRLIANIQDPAQREQALQDAKEGRASAREIQRRARDTAGGAAAPAKTASGKSAPAKADPPPPPKKGTEIVLLAKVDGKAKRHPFVSGKSGQPLKHFRKDHDDYVEVPLSNEVSIQVAPVFDKDGNLTHLSFAFLETH